MSWGGIGEWRRAMTRDDAYTGEREGDIAPPRIPNDSRSPLFLTRKRERERGGTQGREHNQHLGLGGLQSGSHSSATA